MSFGLVGILVEHADKLPVLLSRVSREYCSRKYYGGGTGLKPDSYCTCTVLVLFSNRTGTVPQYCYVVSTTAKSTHSTMSQIAVHYVSNCRTLCLKVSQIAVLYRITTYSSYLLYLFVTSFDSIT